MKVFLFCRMFLSFVFNHHRNGGRVTYLAVYVGQDAGRQQPQIRHQVQALHRQIHLLNEVLQANRVERRNFCQLFRHFPRSTAPTQIVSILTSAPCLHRLFERDLYLDFTDNSHYCTFIREKRFPTMFKSRKQNQLSNGSLNAKLSLQGPLPDSTCATLNR